MKMPMRRRKPISMSKIRPDSNDDLRKQTDSDSGNVLRISLIVLELHLRPGVPSAFVDELRQITLLILWTHPEVYFLTVQ